MDHRTLNKLKTHRERLRRHYEAAVEKYDEITLQDLSNTLRTWAELKPEIGKLIPSFVQTNCFATMSPPDIVKKMLRRTEAAIVYFPSGVVSRAHQGVIAEGSFKQGSPISFAGQVMQTHDGSLQIYSFILASKSFPKAELLKLSEMPVEKKINYPRWLGAEVIRIYKITPSDAQPMEPITREVVIRRMANVMDGSHSSLARNGENYQPRSADHLLNMLMSYTYGGLPLPYLVLIKISQDILNQTEFLKPNVLQNSPA